MRLVLLRHGQSSWNLENRFTGWTDVDLSERGVQEAHSAGELLREEGYCFDVVYTSVLKRAIRTAWIVLDELDLMWIPIHCKWQLNERHYGALQGLDKQAAAEKYGEAQVHAWRRSYLAQPPLAETPPANPGRDSRYADLSPEKFPKTESLADTLARVLPCWQTMIAPTLRQRKRVIVVAHGNSLRALVKHLGNVSDEDIESLEIPTGIPLVYELDGELHIETHYPLSRPGPSRPADAHAADRTRKPNGTGARPEERSRRGGDPPETVP